MILNLKMRNILVVGFRKYLPRSQGTFLVLRILDISESVDRRSSIGLQREPVNFENQSSNSVIDILLTVCLGNRKILAC